MNPRLRVLWPVACEACHPENFRTILSNSGAQAPRHDSSSEVVSLWVLQLRGVGDF
jgi:hypothetical protein